MHVRVPARKKLAIPDLRDVGYRACAPKRTAREFARYQVEITSIVQRFTAEMSIQIGKPSGIEDFKAVPKSICKVPVGRVRIKIRDAVGGKPKYLEVPRLLETRKPFRYASPAVRNQTVVEVVNRVVTPRQI